MKSFRASPERDPVEPLDGELRRPVRGRLRELAELGSVEVVGLPELVHEPHDLVSVADPVRGELGRDHELDGLRRVPVHVDEPPEERLVEHVGAAIPGERDGDELDLVTAQPELVGQLIRDDLRPAVDERNLRPADGDPHECSSRAIRSSRSSISFRTASLNAR